MYVRARPQSRRAELTAQLALCDDPFAVDYLMQERGQLTLAELWILVFAHERRRAGGARAREAVEG